MNDNNTETIANYSALDADNANIQPVWGQYGGITSVVALFILTEQMFTLYGMVKLKRLPFATKFLSCVNLALDCLFVIILVIAAPYNSIFEQNDTVTHAGKRVGRQLVVSCNALCRTILVHILPQRVQEACYKTAGGVRVSSLSMHPMDGETLCEVYHHTNRLS